MVKQAAIESISEADQFMLAIRYSSCVAVISIDGVVAHSCRNLPTGCDLSTRVPTEDSARADRCSAQLVAVSIAQLILSLSLSLSLNKPNKHTSCLRMGYGR